MSGFCLMTAVASGGAVVRANVVDLGSQTVEGFFETKHHQVVWKSPVASKQWTIIKEHNRFLLIEGQPDRLPNPGETLGAWLDGRWGSFRGVEIMSDPDRDADRVSAFVDPLGTRPLFYSLREGGICLSDKLATLAINQRRMQVNWAAVLEATLLGQFISRDTTLEGGLELGPGEVLEIADRRVTSRCYDGAYGRVDLTPRQVSRDPVGTLAAALERAVGEVWTDPDTWIALSGGLDSRTLLTLGGPGRKALCVTTRENRESELARAIATRVGAEFRHFARSSDVYTRLLREGFLATGCLHHPLLQHHLFVAPTWRQAGITSVTHGYLVDTLLKGSHINIWPRANRPAASLESVMDSKGWLILQGESTGPVAIWGRESELALSLLSREGRQMIRERLVPVTREIQQVRSGPYDLTHERMTLGRISRQVYYSYLLTLFESMDVQSPTFHPALWAWNRHSSPGHRYEGWAFRRALLSLNHPAASVPNSNTGAPIERGKHPSMRHSLAFYPGYRFARGLWRRLRPAPTEPASPASPPNDREARDEGSWPPLLTPIRSRDGMDALREGCSHLSGNPIFDYPAIEKALDDFQSGRSSEFYSLGAMCAAGRFSDLCARGSLPRRGTEIAS